MRQTVLAASRLLLAVLLVSPSVGADPGPKATAQRGQPAVGVPVSPAHQTVVAPAGQPTSVTYAVGPGDELYVDFPLKGSVADLQPLGGNGLQLVVVGSQVYFRYTVTVTSDGFIMLPAMKPLYVSGMTVDQVRNEIGNNMRSFDLRGNLSVILARQNNSAFFVSGQVVHPGRFIYERQTSLEEAIVTAGGPTINAKMSKVLLMRKGQPTQKINLSYNEVRDHGAPDIPIYPNDMVIVPRHWFVADNTRVYFILSILGTSVAVYAATK